jgi:hypothetical protein
MHLAFNIETKTLSVNTAINIAVVIMTGADMALEDLRGMAKLKAHIK